MKAIVSRGASRALMATVLFSILPLVSWQASSECAARPKDKGQVYILPVVFTVRQGPSAGLQKVGMLALNVEPAGGVDQGSFASTVDSAEYAVTGEVNGRAVNLDFDLGNGQHLSAVGTTNKPVSEWAQSLADRSLVAGGPFVGPLEGDLGDWGACIGSAGKCSQTPPPQESKCVRCIKACENAGGKHCASSCSDQKLCD